MMASSQPFEALIRWLVGPQ